MQPIMLLPFHLSARLHFHLVSPDYIPILLFAAVNSQQACV
jgi:hypothetical protein